MKTTLLVTLAAFTLTACSTNPYTGEQQASKSAWGAAAGAATGAAIGMASSSKKDRTKGALIGITAGAALGGGVGYYMDVQEAKLKDKLNNTGVTVTRMGNDLKVNLPSTLSFASGSTRLNAEGQAAVDAVAVIVAEFNKTLINVYGHTDNTGKTAQNMTLSEQRAQAVADGLQQKGVARNRLTTHGVGDAEPMVSNDTAEGRAKNRRVTIILTPTS